MDNKVTTIVLPKRMLKLLSQLSFSESQKFDKRISVSELIRNAIKQTYNIE